MQLRREVPWARSVIIAHVLGARARAAAQGGGHASLSLVSAVRRPGRRGRRQERRVSGRGRGPAPWRRGSRGESAAPSSPSPCGGGRAPPWGGGGGGRGAPRPPP